MSTSFYAYKKSKSFNEGEYLEGLHRSTRLDLKLRSLIEAEDDFKALNKSYEQLDEEEFEAISWQPKVDKYLREAEEFDFFNTGSLTVWNLIVLMIFALFLRLTVV